MTRFAGDELPAGDGEIFVRSGVLSLLPGGRFTLEVDRDHCCDENGESYHDPVDVSGNYTVSNGVFLSLAMDIATLTGRIFPDYLTLDDGATTDKNSVWIRVDQ